MGRGLTAGRAPWPPDPPAGVAIRTRTRRTGANRPGASTPSCHMESAAIGRFGSRSHARIDRPSAGKAARSIAECAATRRRFVREPETTIHTDTLAGSQSRSLAICAANRRFRSTVPTSSLASEMSVFSSVTRRARLTECQASKSMTPRSPQMENDTSGASVHSGKSRLNATAIDSWRAEWRALSIRSKSPPRHRGSRSRRMSRAAAVALIVRSDRESKWPRSTLEIDARETFAAVARSCCRIRRRIRTARNMAPARWSSMVAMMATDGAPLLIRFRTASAQMASRWPDAHRRDVGIDRKPAQPRASPRSPAQARGGGRRPAAAGSWRRSSWLHACGIQVESRSSRSWAPNHSATGPTVPSMCIWPATRNGRSGLYPAGGPGPYRTSVRIGTLCTSRGQLMPGG